MSRDEFNGIVKHCFEGLGAGLPHALSLHSSSFWGFIYRILYRNPKKELPWSLWASSNYTQSYPMKAERAGQLTDSVRPLLTGEDNANLLGTASLDEGVGGT